MLDWLCIFPGDNHSSPWSLNTQTRRCEFVLRPTDLRNTFIWFDFIALRGALMYKVAVVAFRLFFIKKCASMFFLHLKFNVLVAWIWMICSWKSCPSTIILVSFCSHYTCSVEKILPCCWVLLIIRVWLSNISCSTTRSNNWSSPLFSLWLQQHNQWRQLPE